MSRRSAPPSPPRRTGPEKVAPPPEEEYLWGIQPILELLRSRPGQIRELQIQQGKAGPKLQEMIDRARGAQVKIRFVPHLKNPAGRGKQQGVLARISPWVPLALDDLLARCRPAASPVLLVLDSILDPHNLGALIRSAAAAGVCGVILPRDRSAPLGGTAAKASAGGLAHLDVCVVTNLVAALERLQKEGFWIFGAAAEGERSIYQTEFNGPLCLVAGGEEKGIRPLVREKCDFLVSIPMQGPLDSLNVSVATGIILFEMLRQRLAGR